jgi:hypothetical protein
MGYKGLITAPMVYKMMGISKEKYRDLLDRGYIKPTRPAGGKGKPAFFSMQDACDIKLFLHLTDSLHFPRENAHWFIKIMKDYPDNIYKIDKRKVKDEDLTRYSAQQIWFVMKKDTPMGSCSIYLVSLDRKELPKIEELSELYEILILKADWDDILIVDMDKIRKFVDAGIINAA